MGAPTPKIPGLDPSPGLGRSQLRWPRTIAALRLSSLALERTGASFSHTYSGDKIVYRRVRTLQGPLADGLLQWTSQGVRIFPMYFEAICLSWETSGIWNGPQSGRLPGPDFEGPSEFCSGTPAPAMTPACKEGRCEGERLGQRPVAHEALGQRKQAAREPPCLPHLWAC